MKTTVDLPEALLAEVRAAAKRRGWTVKVMFEESVRAFVNSERVRAPATPGRLEHTIVTGEGPANPALTFAEMLEISGINRTIE